MRSNVIKQTNPAIDTFKLLDIIFKDVFNISIVESFKYIITNDIIIVISNLSVRLFLGPIL